MRRGGIGRLFQEQVSPLGSLSGQYFFSKTFSLDTDGEHGTVTSERPVCWL